MISSDACRDYRSFLYLDFIPRLLSIFLYLGDNKETHTLDSFLVFLHFMCFMIFN